MGKVNNVMKPWISTGVRFADFCNAVLCDGGLVFKPENLEKDDCEKNLAFRTQDGELITVQKYRDVNMKAKLGMKLLLLACENQTDIHYAMPVRNMLYDSMDYTEQVKDIAKNNREAKRTKTSAEFLSGFMKDDKLFPVVTMVLYLGDAEWDGSTTLHELLDMTDEEYEMLKDYIPNYKINLVDAKELAKSNVLRSDLQYIFSMLLYKEDKEALKRYMDEHMEYFRNVDDDTYNAAALLMGSEAQLKKFKKHNEKGGFDMCKAIDDMCNDYKEEGKEEADNRYSKLILLLTQDGKLELITKVASDSEFRKELYKEYDI